MSPPIDITNDITYPPPVARPGRKTAQTPGTLSPKTLTSNLVHSARNSSSSWTAFAYEISCHSILLMIFFVLSIYKSVQDTYRRVYLRYLTLSYYPAKSPRVIRDDVTKLTKIPKSVSCILDFKGPDHENGGVDGLISEISELATWSVSAGIPHLSIYEYTGVLVAQHQRYLPSLNKALQRNLASYFGSDHIPRYSVRIPHKNVVVYSDASKVADLEILLLARVDGKPTIVELTRTMSELAMNKEISVDDIDISLINQELVDLVGPEPDLLIGFGPSLDLQDYPPWHIRLSEIYWEPGNRNVSYAVFVRALGKFARCKMNVGR